MPVETPTGETQYQGSDRRVAVKDQVMNVLLDRINSFGRIVESSTNPYSDPRIDFMTNFLMTFTLNKKRAVDMMNERFQRIKDETKGVDDTEEKNFIIGRINLEYIAECMESFDDYIGFSKRQVILEVKDGESVKYANELNNTYIDMMMANRGDLIAGITAEESDES